jgi:HEAT repeat protein
LALAAIGRGFLAKRFSWADKLLGPMYKAETLHQFVNDISRALESFNEKTAESKKTLNDLANSDPAVFFVAGLRVVCAAKPSEGLRHLILALAKDKRLSLGLLDSSICTLEEALAISQAAADAGVQLQAPFEMALNKALQGQANPQKAELISRILDLLAITGDPSCWSSFQVELMAYPDKIVRSHAALLIGRSTRNVAWIARRMLDRDPRVQASAVEALWGLDPDEVRPHYLAALKSTHNRVAANAGLGLYLSGDVTAQRILLEMLRHDDPFFRRSALWAIGETQDERFLPALTEYYKQADGKLRLAAVGAMSRIRRHGKAAHDAGPLQLHMSQAVAQAGGVRRLVFALSCHPARDLSGIKPTDFTVWENGTIIDEYQVRLASPPALLMAGFLAPWFASDDESYEKAVREGLKQCLCMKRRDDLWRIDRYSIEITPPVEEKASLEYLVPYDDSLVTGELKAAQGCISDPQLMAKALALPVPRQRAAADPLAAFQRQSDVLVKRAGKRHVFLLLHEMSGADLQQEAAMNRLGSIMREVSLVLHVICPDCAGKWPLLREMCLSNPEGSFTETTLAGMVDGLVDAYANLCSRFEITYSIAAAEASPTERSAVKLKISSEQGYVDTEISLDLPAAAASTQSVSPALDTSPVSAPREAAQPVT